MRQIAEQFAGGQQVLAPGTYITDDNS